MSSGGSGRAAASHVARILGRNLATLVPLLTDGPEALNPAGIKWILNASRSKSTFIARLKIFRQATGMDPAALRRISSHLTKIEDDIANSNARTSLMMNPSIITTESWFPTTRGWRAPHLAHA